SDEVEPKKPSTTYKNIMNGSNDKKKPGKKTDTKKPGNMTDEELDAYLRRDLRSNSSAHKLTEATAKATTSIVGGPNSSTHKLTEATAMPTTDLVLMGNYLEARYSQITGKEKSLLKEYLKYGDDLSEARSKFGLLKKKSNPKLT